MKIIFLLTGLLISISASGIELSDNGEGDAIIFPFYTVENEHKTNFKVTNNTMSVKSVKILFYESFLEIPTLDFNVYLAPMDSWDADMFATLSIWRPGNPAAELVFTDNSCAPFVTPGVQLRPFLIETISSPYGTDMDRLQTGSIVIMDMGEVVDPEAQNILFTDGIPNDCQRIENNWRSPFGDWLDDREYSMSTINGGMSGELTVIDTVDNSSFSISPIVLNNSLQRDLHHDSPGSIRPSLQRDIEDTQIQFNGETIEYTWGHDAQAVSALLQKTSITSSFDFTQADDTQINWVISMINKMGRTPIGSLVHLRPPYSSVLRLEDHGACDEVIVEVRDEAGELLNPLLNQDFRLCETVNVIPIKPFGVAPDLFLDDAYRHFINVGFIEKGSITIKTKPENQMRGDNLLNPQDDKIFYGLPMTGFQVTRIDDGVNPVVYQHQEFTSTREIFSDWIFDHGFE